MAARVGIVMGSESDREVMDLARAVLEDLGVECDVRVMSAHRNPDEVAAYAAGAEAAGIRVLVAASSGSSGGS